MDRARADRPEGTEMRRRTVLSGMVATVVGVPALLSAGGVSASATALDPGPGWTEIPGNGFTPSAPAPATRPSQQVLLLRGLDDTIQINQGNGFSWLGYRELPGGGRTQDAPGVTVVGLDFYVFVRGTDDHI